MDWVIKEVAGRLYWSGLSAPASASVPAPAPTPTPASSTEATPDLATVGNGVEPSERTKTMVA